MYSTARFILSKAKLEEQYKKVESFGLVSFSFKTNPEVGKLLESTSNCFFSLHSHELLKNIKDKNRVWFFAQAWDDKELQDLFAQGINKFVVDNEADLKTLINYIEQNNTKIQLLLRMRLQENTVHTGKHFVFGMLADEINNNIPLLKKNPLITKLGIHFHRKTQNISEWSLKDELNESLSETTWDAIDILNIGGGFPVEYKNSRPALEPIFAEITKLKEILIQKEIQLILEPGRFLSAPCIKLETEIKNIYKNNIIVDCSVYNTAIDTFGAHIRLAVENELEDTGEAFTIKGSTPCSLDIFRYRVYLKDPKKGDKIIFLNAGAYNFKTDFCGLEKVNTIVVD
ncbi:MAG: decarboxylase [Candidatus Woesearchaeota archaeon]|jgi:ornithine decarboxylase|nr:decarboxylase [Candidatus Woesearchaeota archaeon]MDP7323474.1 decarboxylase [Candidatus Woesearchaeota archaeon]MDP7457910.1 decarboxylase [Candidatus Woesearchaeota archaeon]